MAHAPAHKPHPSRTLAAPKSGASMNPAQYKAVGTAKLKG